MTSEQKEKLISRLTDISSEIMNIQQEFFMVTIKELSDKIIGIGIGIGIGTGIGIGIGGV